MQPRLLARAAPRGALTLLLAVLAVGGWGAGRAAASATQVSTFQDDNQLVFGTPATRDATLDELVTLGVQQVRVSVFWADVAPDAQSTTRPDFDATNPDAYPAGVWDRYDALIAAGALVGALTILAMSAQISDPIAEAILAGFIGVGPVAAAIAAVGALWATKRTAPPRKS